MAPGAKVVFNNSISDVVNSILMAAIFSGNLERRLILTNGIIWSPCAFTQAIAICVGVTCLSFAKAFNTSTYRPESVRSAGDGH